MAAQVYIVFQDRYECKQIYDYRIFITVNVLHKQVAIKEIQLEYQINVSVGIFQTI